MRRAEDTEAVAADLIELLTGTGEPVARRAQRPPQVVTFVRSRRGLRQAVRIEHPHPGDLVDRQPV